MNEQFRENSDITPELEGQKFREVTAAMDEQARLMAEIVAARGTTEEEIVSTRVSPLLNEASKKTQKAMREWLDLRKISDKRKGKKLY